MNQHQRARKEESAGDASHSVARLVGIDCETGNLHLWDRWICWGKAEGQAGSAMRVPVPRDQPAHGRGLPLGDGHPAASCVA